MSIVPAPLSIGTGTAHAGKGVPPPSDGQA
jgi:hypothetical protein